MDQPGKPRRRPKAAPVAPPPADLALDHDRDKDRDKDQDKQRREKIANLKKAIEDGTYKVSSEEVARKLIHHMLEPGE